MRLGTAGVNANPCGIVQVVLALDADFVVSAGLHEKLSSHDASAALLEDVSIQRNVVVLPAFETESSLGLEKGGEIANLAQQGTACLRCPLLQPSCSSLGTLTLTLLAF